MVPKSIIHTSCQDINNAVTKEWLHQDPTRRYCRDLTQCCFQDQRVLYSFQDLRVLPIFHALQVHQQSDLQTHWNFGRPFHQNAVFVQKISSTRVHYRVSRISVLSAWKIMFLHSGEERGVTAHYAEVEYCCLNQRIVRVRSTTLSRLHLFAMSVNKSGLPSTDVSNAMTIIVRSATRTFWGGCALTTTSI